MVIFYVKHYILTLTVHSEITTMYLFVVDFYSANSPSNSNSDVSNESVSKASIDSFCPKRDQITDSAFFPTRILGRTDNLWVIQLLLGQNVLKSRVNEKKIGHRNLPIVHRVLN